jgi:hypothetical protein
MIFILVIFTGAGSATAEFSTLAACLSAAETIRDSRTFPGKLELICIPKEGKK